MMLNIRTLLAAAAIAAVAILPSPAVSQGAYGKVEQPWFMQGKISGGVSVGSSSAATALPAAGQVAAICNTGSVDASLAFGADNTVAAVLATSTTLKAGACRSYDLLPFGVLFKYVAAISASSTTLTVETGIGTPTFNGAAVAGGSTTANQGEPNTGAKAWPVTNGTYTPTAPTTSGATVLVAGGTAQTLFTTAEVVHDCLIINPATATERVWVNFFTTATQGTDASSMPLEIGQAIPCGGGLTTAVSWIAATINHRIFALKK